MFVCRGDRRQAYSGLFQAVALLVASVQSTGRMIGFLRRVSGARFAAVGELQCGAQSSVCSVCLR